LLSLLHNVLQPRSKTAGGGAKRLGAGPVAFSGEPPRV
jgi:hypothetical protein